MADKIVIDVFKEKKAEEKIAKAEESYEKRLKKESEKKRLQKEEKNLAN